MVKRKEVVSEEDETKYRSLGVTKKSHKGLYLLLFLLVVSLTIVVAIPKKNITCPVSYQATENYNEPYEECNDVTYSFAQENYNVNSACSRETCTDRSWWSGDCITTTCTQYTYTCQVTIKNNELTGATFSLEGVFKTVNGEVSRGVQSIYIQPGSSQRFAWTYVVSDQTQVINCYYKQISIPSKTVCQTHVKEATRTVTKVRDETKSVNWLFGGSC